MQSISRMYCIPLSLSLKPHNLCFLPLSISAQSCLVLLPVNYHKLRAWMASVIVVNHSSTAEKLCNTPLGTIGSTHYNTSARRFQQNCSMFRKDLKEENPTMDIWTESQSAIFKPKEISHVTLTSQRKNCAQDLKL